MKKQQEDYGKELQEAYDRWAHLYEHGGSDPFHTDGTNLFLVRNHIIYYRRMLEENPTLEGYPVAYYKEIPPEVDQNYMARPDEIRAAAKVSLETYKADPNYQYILQHYNDFSSKTRNKLCIDNVIGYATGLEQYIKEDRLVDMRRHERCENYLKAFEDCAGRMRETAPESYQQSLFSVTDNNNSAELDGDDADEDGFDEEENEEYDGPEMETVDEIIVQNKVKAESGNEYNNDQSANNSPYDNIPIELKSLNQWTVFRTYTDNESGKLKKVIISPVNSAFAHVDMPETWTGYEQAKAYAEKYKRYTGLAFALVKGITFIDIDNAIKDGEIVLPEAKRLLELLPDTYVEKSVSGTGIHILLKGSLPSDAYRRNDRAGIEAYDTRRFICMTGDVLNASREIKDYSDRIGQIAYDFVGQRPPLKEYKPMPATQSDTELIEKISSSRQGIKFQALYKGDASGYPSWSHADSALVFILAWWTQNPLQIERIFRSSGLIRSKWDEKRGNGTYGSQLINEALSTVIPRQERKSQENYI